MMEILKLKELNAKVFELEIQNRTLTEQLIEKTRKWNWIKAQEQEVTNNVNAEHVELGKLQKKVTELKKLRRKLKTYHVKEDTIAAANQLEATIKKIVCKLNKKFQEENYVIWGKERVKAEIRKQDYTFNDMRKRKKLCSELSFYEILEIKLALEKPLTKKKLSATTIKDILIIRQELEGRSLNKVNVMKDDILSEIENLRSALEMNKNEREKLKNEIDQIKRTKKSYQNRKTFNIFSAPQKRITVIMIACGAILPLVAIGIKICNCTSATIPMIKECCLCRLYLNNNAHYSIIVMGN